MMSRVGIVTGSGPEAGLDLWAKILGETRRFLGERFRGDLDAPEIAVLSNPRLGLSMELGRHESQVRTELLRTVAAIDPLTDCFAIACNTLHCFAADILDLRLRSRFISMVDATARHLRRAGHRCIAILGSDTVMDLDGRSPYASLAGEFQCESVQEPERVQSLIYEIKRRGNCAATQTEFAAFVARVQAPVVLLACTELPLVAHVQTDKQLIDPTAVLARELMTWSRQAR